eukprot:scaffold3701_cov192-Alexandrium_tamarense.AAC.31
MVAPSYLHISLIAAFWLPMQQVVSFQPTLSSFRSRVTRGHHPSTSTRSTIISELSESKTSTDAPTTKRPRRPSSNKKKRPVQQELKNPNEVVTWRVYGIDVDPDNLADVSSATETSAKANEESIPLEKQYLTEPVLRALLSRLRIKTTDDVTIALPEEVKDARVVRRSIDARRRRGAGPKYTYVVDVDITREKARDLRFVHQSGRLELVDDAKKNRSVSAGDEAESDSKPKVVICGAGPAGLFCALSLATAGFKPILLERGQPVEARGKSIGALIHRRSIDPESNFSFGEGGAGEPVEC